MAGLSDYARRKITEVMTQFAKDRNVLHALMTVEVVFEYERAHPTPDAPIRSMIKRGASYRVKKVPEEWSFDEHLMLVDGMFKTKDAMRLSELMPLIKAAYGVGMNLIEKRDGYLPYLRINGFITRELAAESLWTRGEVFKAPDVRRHLQELYAKAGNPQGTL
jgi:hypothetical protein